MLAKTTLTPPSFGVRPAPPVAFFESEEHSGPPSTILIVDSEEINRRLLKAIFKTAPYRMLECRKASEAMALLQSEKIDLVILDLMLPEMSGPELCRWMKADRRTQLIPVLMITNRAGRGERNCGHLFRRRRIPDQAVASGGGANAHPRHAAQQGADRFAWKRPKPFCLRWRKRWSSATSIPGSIASVWRWRR